MKQTVLIITRSKSRWRVDRFVHPRLEVVRSPPLVAVLTNVVPPEMPLDIAVPSLIRQ